MPYIINHTQLSSYETEKLFLFFKAQHALGINVWKKNTVYSFDDKTEFSFAYDVLQRKRENGKDGHRYELISSIKLGKGGFSTIYEIEGTLKITSNSTEYKQHGYGGKTRVVKIQQHTEDNPVDVVFNEYKLTKHAQNLHIKEPVIDNQTSYTIMKKIKGRDLVDIIIDDYAGKHILTLKQRVEISKILLIALKNLTDKNIIHRDIKPDNIRINMTSPITVDIYDFGLSVDGNELDGRHPGTLGYAAPEQFSDKPQTSKIDVFSLGRVLATLWRIDTGSYFPNDPHEAKHNADNVSLDTLFRGIQGLDSKNQEHIKSTLQSMLMADHTKRASIDEAIDLFSAVNIQQEHVVAIDSLWTTFNGPLSSRYKQSKERIEIILQQIIELKAWANDLDYHTEHQAARNLRDLSTRLETVMLELLKMDEAEYKANILQYIKECQELINNNRNNFQDSTIYRHHLWGNLALAIAGLGVFYIAASVINMALTGNFLFFNKTINQSFNTVLYSLDEAEYYSEQDKYAVS